MNLSAHDLVDVAVEGCGGKIVHLSEELGNPGIGLLSNIQQARFPQFLLTARNLFLHHVGGRAKGERTADPIPSIHQIYILKSDQY